MPTICLRRLTAPAPFNSQVQWQLSPLCYNENQGHISFSVVVSGKYFKSQLTDLHPSTWYMPKLRYSSTYTWHVRGKEITSPSFSIPPLLFLSGVETCRRAGARHIQFVENSSWRPLQQFKIIHYSGNDKHCLRVSRTTILTAIPHNVWFLFSNHALACHCTSNHTLGLYWSASGLNWNYPFFGYIIIYLPQLVIWVPR